MGMRLLFLLYDALLCLGLLACIPVLFCRGKMTVSALKGKLGFIGREEERETIWIHAVSVGEVNVIGRLVERLRQESSRGIVVSTTTLSGYRSAQEKYGCLARVIYLPFDLSFLVRRVVRLVRPKVFISAETEIWPNLFFRLNRLGVPVVIVNGRISDRAYARYRLIRPVMKRVFGWCSCVSVQNQQYKERFTSLGCEESRITVSGQMKFEMIGADDDVFARCAKKYAQLFPETDVIRIIAGSTHPGEEEIVLGAFTRLAVPGRRLRLIVAPRHMERVHVVEKIVRRFGFQPVRLTAARGPVAPGSVLVLDVIGELRYFYSISDICFVGGSFKPHGGHNIMEPIHFMKPTIFGPHMENFRDVEELVLRSRAGIKVQTPRQLEAELGWLVNDSEWRAALGARCRQVFLAERTRVEEQMAAVTRKLHEYEV